MAIDKDKRIVVHASIALVGEATDETRQAAVKVLQAASEISNQKSELQNSRDEINGFIAKIKKAG